MYLHICIYSEIHFVYGKYCTFFLYSAWYSTCTFLYLYFQVNSKDSRTDLRNNDPTDKQLVIERNTPTEITKDYRKTDVQCNQKPHIENKDSKLNVHFSKPRESLQSCTEFINQTELDKTNSQSTCFLESDSSLDKPNEHKNSTETTQETVVVQYLSCHSSSPHAADQKQSSIDISAAQDPRSESTPTELDIQLEDSISPDTTPIRTEFLSDDCSQSSSTLAESNVLLEERTHLDSVPDESSIVFISPPGHEYIQTMPIYNDSGPDVEEKILVDTQLRSSVALTEESPGVPAMISSAVSSDISFLVSCVKSPVMSTGVSNVVTCEVSNKMSSSNLEDGEHFKTTRGNFQPFTNFCHKTQEYLGLIIVAMYSELLIVA